MLDNETKKRIDTARDILVGKVPDPKSQVEQITIALIYKFMDDMDKEAVDFGGEATFFAGEYEKYSWTKIFDPKIGGHEMLNLYGEAIVKLNINPNIPQLFRDIFKNAYLPYRDPETLKLFLKTINDFRYDHSEMLGDAFEYLLSVLGSQGDAGQFRTPRHIIDFMVKVLEPQKGESSCDPACGTAGFLVSSYKQIVEQNTKKSKGDLLTPDDRKRMMQNFVGYDISPDMVRLSLVNLYLHGFTAPRIYEYDTLTSEERWNEYYDIIYANPPFMTPKGGIKPHKKFTVQATKSEVLFVDYIAEHINPSTGRAAIIVPNGIVATTQTAYMQLRKLLVNESLIAVISLPAGVFQPYSGVKTSILILDKRLSKKSKHILFLKIDNDGFGLGSQRNEIESNDLPLALETILDYKRRIGNNEPIGEFPGLATLVEKSLVLKNKDVVLSSDRYVVGKPLQSTFKISKLDDLCIFKRGPFGGSLKKEIFVSNGNLVYEQYHAINNDFEFGRYFIDDFKFAEMKGFEVRPNDLLISCSGTMGKIAIVPKNAKRGIINQALLKLTPNIEKIDSIYLKKVLETEEVQKRYFRDQEGAAIQNVASVKVLKEIEIPLPPLDIQQQIVAEIEAYQKIIDGAKQVVNNYKPTISIKPEWKIMELGQVCDHFQNGLNFSTEQVGRGTKFINIKDLYSNIYVNISNLEQVEISEKEKESKKVTDGDLLFVRSSVKYEGVGFPSLVKTNNEEIVFCGFIIKCTPIDTIVIPEYLLFLLRTQKYRNTTVSLSNRSSITNISQDNLKTIKIPIPSLHEQTLIVQRIEEEQSLVNSNKRLIEIFEQKIKDKIDEVWGVKDEKKYAVPNDELLIGSEDFD